MNRVERIAGEFTELLDRFEQLSLPEQAEVRKKVGWPNRTKLHRVTERPHWGEQATPIDEEEPDLEEIDLVLRVPEIGSEEKRNKLLAFLQQRGLEWDDLHEYVFFHFHPEWYDAHASPPYGEHLFVGEVLFDDVISIHVQYDRAKLIDRLKDLAPVAIEAKDDEEAGRKTFGWLLHGPISERGESKAGSKAFERLLLMSDAVYKQNAGEDNEKIEFELVRNIAPLLRNLFRERDAIPMEAIERLDRQFAIEMEYGICDGLTRVLAIAARNFFVSLVEAILSENGQVSATRYKELTWNRFNYLRVQDQGGKRNVKIADWPREYLERLGLEREALKGKFQGVRNKAKRYHEDKKKRDLWRDHLMLDYPILNDYLDILDVMGRVYFAYESGTHPHVGSLEPREIEWEIAARRSNPDYEPFSVNAETLREHAIRPGN
jgi:hypothetical protein